MFAKALLQAKPDQPVLRSQEISADFHLMSRVESEHRRGLKETRQDTERFPKVTAMLHFPMPNKMILPTK